MKHLPPYRPEDLAKSPDPRNESEREEIRVKGYITREILAGLKPDGDKQA